MIFIRFHGDEQNVSKHSVSKIKVKCLGKTYL